MYGGMPDSSGGHPCRRACRLQMQALAGLLLGRRWPARSWLVYFFGSMRWRAGDAIVAKVPLRLPSQAPADAAAPSFISEQQAAGPLAAAQRRAPTSPLALCARAPRFVPAPSSPPPTTPLARWVPACQLRASPRAFCWRPGPPG